LVGQTLFLHRFNSGDFVDDRYWLLRQNLFQYLTGPLISYHFVNPPQKRLLEARFLCGMGCWQKQVSS